jgi:hypothetical protein
MIRWTGSSDTCFGLNSMTALSLVVQYFSEIFEKLEYIHTLVPKSTTARLIQEGTTGLEQPFTRPSGIVFSSASTQERQAGIKEV